LVRADLRGEGDQGFRSGKGLFKRLDKFDGGKPKAFEETFHPNLFLSNTRKKIEEILRTLGIRIEADMEGLITIRDSFFNGLEDTFHVSKGHLFSTRDGLDGGTTTPTPGTLNRASSAHSEIIDGRLERIHPEILLFRNSLHIKRLADIMDVGRMIL
jgi:hypothetical protein